MSDQPQKYQNIREFLDNLPVVPCAWQPDNPNICNTCLRINDSVARICSVWAQAHEDAPLEEMEFDEEISSMPSIEAIEKDFEEEILESETVEPVVAEEEVAEVAAVEPVVAEEEIPESVESEINEEEVSKTSGKKPFWKFWGKKEEVKQTEEKEVKEEDEIPVKTEPDVSESGFEIGEEVTHKVYGKGPIKTLYLSREKWFADVEFYKGVKSILVSFLQRPDDEIEEDKEIVEEEPSDLPVEIEEDVKEKPIVSTEREIPPIITPKEEPQSGEQEPKITQAIPVEDIDDIEQEKDPEIAVREKVEVERFSEDDED